MKCIIERINGATYIYKQDEKLFKKCENAFQKPLLSAYKLNEECNISYLPKNCHIILNIKDWPKNNE